MQLQGKSFPLTGVHRGVRILLPPFISPSFSSIPAGFESIISDQDNMQGLLIVSCIFEEKNVSTQKDFGKLIFFFSHRRIPFHYLSVRSRSLLGLATVRDISARIIDFSILSLSLSLRLAYVIFKCKW